MFAPFDPAPASREAPLTPLVEPATVDDVEAMTALAIARGDGDPDTRRRGFERLVHRAHEAEGPVVLVARVEGPTIIGYGIADRLVPPEGPYVPAGLYLTGLVVDPAWRRRGAGAALVRARLEALRPRATTVRAFVSAQNRASIALLTAHGFVLEADDVAVPGVEFSGGRGLLYRRDFADPAR